MKKYLSVILCILMTLLTLAGCNASKNIIGTWSTEVDITDKLNEAFGEDAEMSEYLKIEKFAIIMKVTFNEDGTYNMTVDADSAEQSVETAKQNLSDGLYKYFEAAIKEQGISLSVEEFLTYAGVDIDAMTEELFDENTVDNLSTQMTNQGNYKIDGNKLYMSEGTDVEINEEKYEKFKLTSKKLTLLESVGDEEEESAQKYPMVFNRVD